MKAGVAAALVLGSVMAAAGVERGATAPAVIDTRVAILTIENASERTAGDIQFLNWIEASGATMEISRAQFRLTDAGQTTSRRL